jgi:mRNA interferase RelE/StbE
VSGATYSVETTDAAENMILAIADRSVRKMIVNRAQKLKADPGKQGKALVGDLAGLRSIRVCDRRYRIIFRVDEVRRVVAVLGAGIRKDRDKRDIYKLMSKMASRGEL